MARMRLEDFDEATRARIVAAMDGAKNAPRAREGVGMGIDGGNAIKSQTGANLAGKKAFCDEKPPRMNKTETAFYDELKRKYQDGIIIPQPARFFRMDGGGTYTPDFLLFRPSRKVVVYECKMDGAHYNGWEQGVERFKRAAAQFDGDVFVFVMATRLRWGNFQLKVWRQRNEAD